MNKTSTPEIMNLGINSEDLLHYASGETQDEPRQHVVESLLRFSRSLEVKTSKLVGKIESVTN
ncbi:hypothetical protein BH11BAC7_BH11BAC7_09990 [soil metagenome]